MAGRKAFKTLTAEFTPERRAKIDARKADLEAEMALHELRKALGASQVQLAAALGVNQPAIAKIERRSDLRIQSLRRIIEAMGGELVIRARFPEGEVTLTDYHDQPE